MKVRALCTDIDGTLLDGRRELSVRTIAAIKKVSDKVPVILASSRMPSAMRHLQQELGLLDHPMICYNGGYIIHYRNDRSIPDVMDSVCIPSALSDAIVSITKDTGVHVSLYHNDNWYAPAIDQWTERESRITKVDPQIISSEKVLAAWKGTNAGAHKIMCMGAENEIQELAGKLNSLYANDIHVYPSKPTYLEIAPRIVSKASALEFLMQKFYGIDLSEIMNFGDNYNDLEMIQKSGWGVAVENARGEVKAIANEVTLTNVQDGVAVIIEKYLDGIFS